MPMEIGVPVSIKTSHDGDFLMRGNILFIEVLHVAKLSILKKHCSRSLRLNYAMAFAFRVSVVYWTTSVDSTNTCVIRYSIKGVRDFIQKRPTRMRSKLYGMT